MNKYRHRARAARAKPRFDRMTPEQYRKTALERDIQDGIRQLLNLLGIIHSVTDAARPPEQRGAARVDPDWPDLSCVLHRHGGRALFIETKSAHGRVRPGQAALHERLRASGALVLVPRSVEQAETELAAEGYRLDGKA